MFEKKKKKKKKKERNRSNRCNPIFREIPWKYLEENSIWIVSGCDKLESDASPAFFFPIIHCETESLSVTLHTYSILRSIYIVLPHDWIREYLIPSLFRWKLEKEERRTKDILYYIFFISFIYEFFYHLWKILLFVERIFLKDFSYYFPSIFFSFFFLQFFSMFLSQECYILKTLLFIERFISLENFSYYFLSIFFFLFHFSPIFLSQEWYHLENSPIYFLYLTFLFFFLS